MFKVLEGFYKDATGMVVDHDVTLVPDTFASTRCFIVKLHVVNHFGQFQTEKSFYPSELKLITAEDL